MEHGHEAHSNDTKVSAIPRCAHAARLVHAFLFDRIHARRAGSPALAFSQFPWSVDGTAFAFQGFKPVVLIGE
ncbi:MAG: hypothetical protein C5B57_06335 [Blastocatellia bacterium]|nr:MAG: hypothetical protein C5B57_06335 [Blastocatellia bacterium]